MSYSKLLQLILFGCSITFICLTDGVSGFLRPQDSEDRETKSLDGVWKFRLSPIETPDVGFEEKWFETGIEATAGEYEVLAMPVPSSYNDITVEASVRDFLGWAWYERPFFVPIRWSFATELQLYFGSVMYTAKVWVNGREVGGHEMGHLPFTMKVTNFVNFGQENRITVAVNNTLNLHTIPQGQFIWHQQDLKYPAGFHEMTYTFDFFNYAGIHRSVMLFTVNPYLAIEDISVDTQVAETLDQATINYQLTFDAYAHAHEVECEISLLEAGNDEPIIRSSDCNGQLNVSEPHLWWPYLMTDQKPGYLYTLKAQVSHSQLGQDTYRLQVGLRSISWTKKDFLINHRKFYLRGFGRHEDFFIKGRGLDLTVMARDYNLIKWVGANSFRTSHYPYSDEMMDFADREGIVVINECGAVDLDNFDDTLLQNHITAMTELVLRDKNRPSVVMWSIANEPRSQKPKAKSHFRAVADFTRKLDPTRPVTAAISQDVDVDLAAASLDIIGVNRYFGWYSDAGHSELIAYQMANELGRWANKHELPLMILEYGADTIPGFHQLPSYIFTEEYQCELIDGTMQALRANESIPLVGEMVWNFADFMTTQKITRVLGNKKGIFTRDRQPKASAHYVKKKYWQLAAAQKIHL